jgi:hypothetical protein
MSFLILNSLFLSMRPSRLGCKFFLTLWKVILIAHFMISLSIYWEIKMCIN